SLHLHHPQTSSDGMKDKFDSLGLTGGIGSWRNGGDYTAAALLEMDNEFGRLMEALEQTDQAANTLVIFVSDNGPETKTCNLSGSTGPFQARYEQSFVWTGWAKATVWEGGHRVPMMVRWPGVVAPGRVSDALVSTLDVFRTVSDVAQTGPFPTWPHEDGRSLLPLLSEPQGSDLDQNKSARWMVHEHLFHPLPHNAESCHECMYGGFRFRNYKLVSTVHMGKSCEAMHHPNHKEINLNVLSTPLIFDLDQDPAEEFPLDKDHPEYDMIQDKFKKITKSYRQTMNPGRLPHEDSEALQLCCNLREPTGCEEGLFDFSEKSARKFCKGSICGCDSYHPEASSNLPGKPIPGQGDRRQWILPGFTPVNRSEWAAEQHLKQSRPRQEGDGNMAEREEISTSLAASGWSIWLLGAAVGATTLLLALQSVRQYRVDMQARSEHKYSIAFGAD
ncbi:hypothetical protein CYMTET_6601, partial [Cymbomonas tetramitiformis]